MASNAPESIRNLAVVGGGGAGKTSLVDALLFKAGATTRCGKVDDGTSVSDYSAEEKEAKHSLTSTLLWAEHQGVRLNILDTPGYSDFVGEAMAPLSAVDGAVVVLDAAGTINSNTRRLFKAAREMQLPLFVVVNRLDHDQAKWDECWEGIQTFFGRECSVVYLPDGTGAGLSKVVSLLDADAAGAFADQRGALTESLVETDEAAMERYLEEGEVGADELHGLYGKAVHSGEIIPVLSCSVTKDIGVQEILDHLVAYAPSPLQGPGRQGKAGEADVLVRPDKMDKTVVQVFKTVTDPYVGKLSFLRVWAGTLRSDHPLTLTRTGKAEKLANLLQVQGKDSEGVTEAGPGQILAVAKVEHLETNDTLCDGGDGIALEPVHVPPPMVSLAVEPKSRGDEQKLSGALRKLASEDLTFTAERDAVTGELVITGITNLHLDTMIKRLKERFSVEVDTKPPRVPLKETIQAKAEGHHRHKKQTGGAGQFGEVYLKVEPRERGSGFEFVDEVVGGAIPKNFLPAVEKGIVAALDGGVFAGYPVVDVCVRVYDGKHHPVDSNETSFKMAGAKAFKDGFLKAKPCLLEPIVDLEVEVPASAMGDITGDLNSRRGRIQGMDTVGNLQIIRAQVPLKEMLTYSTDLRSMTAGEGSYTFTFSHYDVLPAKLAEEVRAGFKATDED